MKHRWADRGLLATVPVVVSIAPGARGRRESRESFTATRDARASPGREREPPHLPGAQVGRSVTGAASAPVWSRPSLGLSAPAMLAVTGCEAPARGEGVRRIRARPSAHCGLGGADGERSHGRHARLARPRGLHAREAAVGGDGHRRATGPCADARTRDARAARGAVLLSRVDERRCHGSIPRRGGEKHEVASSMSPARTWHAARRAMHAVAREHRDATPCHQARPRASTVSSSLAGVRRDAPRPLDTPGARLKLRASGSRVPMFFAAMTRVSRVTGRPLAVHRARERRRRDSSFSGALSRPPGA